MFEFIDNNGVLFSGIFGIISALIAAMTTLIVEHSKNKNQTIKSLKQELQETNEKLAKYTSIEQMEEHIEKSDGSIYSEILLNGSKRSICGYCWEKNYIKSPLHTFISYNTIDKHPQLIGHCYICNADCYEDLTNE